MPKQKTTVASTWRISFGKLTPASQQLLACLSLLAPDNIPDVIVPALARAKALAGGALSNDFKGSIASEVLVAPKRLRRAITEQSDASGGFGILLKEADTLSGIMVGGLSRSKQLDAGDRSGILCFLMFGVSLLFV
jgi:hypothetical protein